MALTFDDQGGVKVAKKPTTGAVATGAGKALGGVKSIAGAPAPPVMTSPSTPALDEGLAYSLFAPKAGGGQGISTQVAPGGGTINYALGRFNDGYYWVDDGSPEGYYYRPEDGATWRNSGSVASSAASITAGARSVIGGDVAPTKQTNPASIKGPGYAGVQSIIDRRKEENVTGAFSFPEMRGQPGVTYMGGDPEARYTEEQEGYFRFTDAPGQTGTLELKPRGFSDLVTTLVPESVSGPLAEQTTNRLPDWAEEPIEDALAFNTSPLGILSTIASGGLASAAAGGFAAKPFLTGAGLDIASNFAGEFAEQGVKEAGGPGWAGALANVAGGIGPDLGFGAAAALRSTPSGSVAPMPSGAVRETAQAAPTPSVGRQIADILAPENAAPAVAAAPAAPTPRPAWIPEGRPAVPDTVRPITPQAAPVKTVPGGGLLANPKKPKGVEIASGPNPVKKGKAIVEEQVLVDGRDAGIIRRAGVGQPWEGVSYRNPDGALVPVPPKNAAGDLYSGTKPSAQNVVANAYIDKGHLLRDEPKVQRAAPTPSVAAADGAATTTPLSPTGSASGAAPSVQNIPPATDLEAQLSGTLAMVKARNGVMPPAAEVQQATDLLAKGAKATPTARPQPVFKGGEIVVDTRNGEMYAISSAGAKGNRLTITNPDGSPVRGRSAYVPKGSYKYLEEVPAGAVAPEKMSYEALIHEADRYGLLGQLDNAQRQRLHMLEGTPEGDALRAQLEGAIKVQRAETAALQAVNVRGVGYAIHSAPYETGVGRATAGTATPGEVRALEALETETREAIGDLAFHESFPANYIAPPGYAPLADDAAAAAHWAPLVDEWNEALKAEQAGSRVVKAKNRAGGAVVELANAPRTMKASLDMSLRYRQGGTLNVARLAFTNPVNAVRQWALEEREMWRSLVSEPYARWVNEQIVAKPRPGLHITSLDGVLSGREEDYLSSFITRGKYNPFRRTSHSGVTMLNVQRAQFYDMVEANWLASGKAPSKRELQFMANVINHATGRGTGAWLDNVGPALTIGLFSPRWVVSRFQLLVDPLIGATISPRAAWMGTRVLGANLGLQAATAVIIGTMLTRAGMDYETDWRSSSFGQITVKTPVGQMRFDTTAGLQSPIRFIGQLAHGEYKSSTGAIRDRPRWDTIVRYLRSKASPNGGMVADWFFRQIPGLQDFTFPPEEGGISSLPGVRNIPYASSVVHTFGAISLDNAVQYFQKANSPGTAGLAALAAGADIFGFSTQWFDESSWDKRDKLIAADPEFAHWKREGVDVIRGYDDLTDAGQLYARNKYPTEVFTSASKARAAQRQYVDDEFAGDLLGVEDKMRNTFDPHYNGRFQFEGSDAPGKQARDAVNMLKYGRAKQLDLIYKDAPESEKPPTIVKRWMEQIEKNTWPDGLTVDWDAIEAWEATLSERERQEIDDYLGVSRGLKTGILKDIADASTALGDTGYFDTTDVAWKEMQNMHPELGSYADFYEWRRKEISRIAVELVDTSGVSAEESKKMATKQFDAGDLAKRYDTEKEKATLQWVLDNPDAAKTGARWGYYTPNDDTRGYLATGDPTEIITRRDELNVTDAVDRTDIAPAAGPSKFKDWSTTAWKTYAADSRLTAPDGRSGAEFNSSADFAAAGGESDWSESVSKAEYEANPSRYIRVRTGTNKDGSASYEYMSPSNKAESEALLALWRSNPEAVREAFRLDLVGFRTGSGGNISKTQAAWLRDQGVEVPEE